MKTLINLSPKAFEYIDKKAKEWFGNSTYKRSAALERIITEHQNIAELKQFKQEMKEEMKDLKELI
jgi:hypothetical protein